MHPVNRRICSLDRPLQGTSLEVVSKTLEDVEKPVAHVILIRQPTEKNPGICETKQMQRSFVVRRPTDSSG